MQYTLHEECDNSERTVYIESLKKKKKNLKQKCTPCREKGDLTSTWNILVPLADLCIWQIEMGAPCLLVIKIP